VPLIFFEQVNEKKQINRIARNQSKLTSSEN
jgi:hypothetical protein